MDSIARVSLQYGSVKIDVSIYCKGGRREVHAVFVPTEKTDNIESQTKDVAVSLTLFLASEVGKGFVPEFKRVYLSDPTNQYAIVEETFRNIPGATSVIGQTPLYDGVKLAVLVIMSEEVEVIYQDRKVSLFNRGKYKDCWLPARGHDGESYGATKQLISGMDNVMNDFFMTVATNCMRTWFYVRDIDNRYKGMVKARNEYFEHIGLTAATHFIASTGIEGKNGNPSNVVSLEAYAVAGLDKRQVCYLKALDYLNNTSEYGVAFERGTSIEYGDRRHIFLSGTASIDHNGEIVAEKDINGQCRRMAENVKALLRDGRGDLRDVMHCVVYIRDLADRNYVESFIKDHFPQVPVIIVQASVCRPGWLVEMECMAVVSCENSDFAPY